MNQSETVFAQGPNPEILSSESATAKTYVGLGMVLSFVLMGITAILVLYLTAWSNSFNKLTGILLIIPALSAFMCGRSHLFLKLWGVLMTMGTCLLSHWCLSLLSVEDYQLEYLLPTLQSASINDQLGMMEEFLRLNPILIAFYAIAMIVSIVMVFRKH
ncbi:MAG: hypothetical protein K2X66_13280 [Cyanobacteria bacterium]|nr:hypothetical protein [Cyanobacteriota bacterium]